MFADDEWRGFTGRLVRHALNSLDEYRLWADPEVQREVRDEWVKKGGEVEFGEVFRFETAKNGEGGESSEEEYYADGGEVDRSAASAVSAAGGDTDERNDSNSDGGGDNDAKGEAGRDFVANNDDDDDYGEGEEGEDEDEEDIDNNGGVRRGEGENDDAAGERRRRQDHRERELLLAEQRRRARENEISKREVTSQNDKDACKICFSGAANTVIIPCGHMCACVECGSRLDLCPICRSQIIRIQEVFRA